jgi:CHAT domain-containing protein/tetratricopeptide (TPR) repeat protein
MKYSFKLSVITLCLCSNVSYAALDFMRPTYALGENVLSQQDVRAEQFYKTGLKYYDDGRYQESLEFYQKALSLYQKTGSLLGQANVFYKIGMAYQQLNQFHQALIFYQQALPIYQKIGSQQEMGQIFNSIGEVYESLSDYTNALSFFNQSLSIRQSINFPLDEGDTLNNIGSIYNQTSQYSNALKYYQQALKIFKDNNDKIGEATVLANLGTIYNQFGEYKLALQVYNESLITLRELGDRVSEGEVLHNIGLVYARLEDYKQALKFYEQSLKINQELKIKERELMTLNNIGFVYAKLKNNVRALDFLKKALTGFRQIDDKLGEGNTLDSIGQVYQNQKDYNNAFKHYQEALIIFKKIQNRANERVVLSNIGDLFKEQNQVILAIIFYKKSVNVTEAIRKELQVLSKEQQESYTKTITSTYYNLSDLLLSQDRILEAQRVLDLLKVQELDNYFHEIRGNQNTEKGVPTLKPEDKIDEGIEILLAKTINIGQEISQLQERQNHNEKLTPSEQEKLAQLLQQQGKILDNFNQFIKSPEIIALINQLKVQNFSTDMLSRFNSFNSFRKLRNNLKNLDHAVLLYPLILENRLEIILTTSDSVPIHRTVKVTKKELNETILAFRKALKTPLEDAKKPAQKLYQWLIQPIENDLKTVQARTIIYAPDGLLRYIPLAALYDGKQWLIERYQINNITAESLDDLDIKPEPKMRVLAAAFIQGHYEFKLGDQNFKFSGLPFAGPEINQLADSIPSTIKLVDKAFNPKIADSFDSYTIVHLATHAALVVGTPTQSFILFGDGTPVTLAYIKEKWVFTNLDLIVLSACETGLGENFGTGDEILGLGYGLNNAGIRAVIASLWSVDDRGTQALMNAFYEALKTRKYSKTEALQQAQIALINSNNGGSDQQRGPSIEVISNGVPDNVVNHLSHPYYWSPFILIGNGL